MDVEEEPVEGQVPAEGIERLAQERLVRFASDGASGQGMPDQGGHPIGTLP